MDTSAATSDSLPSPHAGSGTAWEPASAPARTWMTARDGWDLMAHGVIFLSYNQQGSPTTSKAAHAARARLSP